MKKNPGSRTIGIFGRLFNVRTWVDFDRMRSFTYYLLNGFRKMFIPGSSEREPGESFESAKERLNLTEQELVSRQRALFRLSLLMSGGALVIFAYAIYHLYYGNYRATIISLVLMLIAFALSFRYHFWYFQIKERKLGCTFKEWYKKGLLGGK